MIKFDEQKQLDSVAGALAIRKEIEGIAADVAGRGYKNICYLGIGGTYASALQTQNHVQEYSGMEIIAQNAALYNTTGNRRIGKDTVIVLSSVTGTTQEVVAAVEKAKAQGAVVIGFVDTADTPLEKLSDYAIRYPQNEQLKFFMLADRLMQLAGDFPQYEQQYAEYARWAKVFNLKQMAQTMNYLSENNLLEYAVLEEKAAAATAHHNELSAQIKAAEKRMAEIAVLRTHIVNYAKTREVYVAYRKAGYSKKFREEHEEEILLHQAAKNAFDEMGVKKLPKVKELQTEYAKLLEEKKKTYAEYRRSREEMRELLTAKANVDRVLKMEVEQDVEKEKDHGQR